MKHFLLLLPLLFSLSGRADGSEAETYTPKPGSVERTAILDPVRTLLEDQINRNVIFVVTHLKVEGDWAFFMGTPKTKEGGEINYAGTVFEEEAAEADEITVALLQNVGGKWTVVTHGFFTTDLWWHELWKNYSGCPASIFERI